MLNLPRIVIEAVECSCQGNLAGTDPDGLCTSCHGRGWVWPEWARRADVAAQDDEVDGLMCLYSAQPKEANDG